MWIWTGFDTPPRVIPHYRTEHIHRFLEFLLISGENFMRIASLEITANNVDASNAYFSHCKYRSLFRLWRFSEVNHRKRDLKCHA